MQIAFIKQFFERKKALIAIVSALGMIIGFMAGRAILSFSMLVFCINALWNISFRTYIKNKWWWLGILWISLYALSYFWCTDIPYWGERMQVKIPFLFLPVAFASLGYIEEKLLKWFTWGIILILFGGTLYSLSFLWANPEQVFNGYFFSNVMPTPAYKDHIRFSIFTAWGVLWCAYRLRQSSTKLEKYILYTAIFYFSIFLHLLAVRSGLMVLYLYAASYFIYIIIKGRYKRALIFGLLACSGIALLYAKVPSFKYRMLYIKYTYEEYQRGNMSANFSDMGRLISYELAAKVIAEHPIFGVGAGDVREEMKHKYEQYSPDTLPEQRIVPHNQFLEVCMGIGFVGLSVFIIWFGYILKGVRKQKAGFFLVACWLGFAASMMVEAMLEVQLGVFVFLFCMLWIHKVVMANDKTELNPQAPATT